MNCELGVIINNKKKIEKIIKILNIRSPIKYKNDEIPFYLYD